MVQIKRKKQKYQLKITSVDLLFTKDQVISRLCTNKTSLRALPKIKDTFTDR